MPSFLDEIQTRQRGLQENIARLELELYDVKHQRRLLVAEAPSPEQRAALTQIDVQLADLNQTINLSRGQLREVESDLLRARNRVQNQRNRLHEQIHRAAEQQRLVVQAEQALAHQLHQLAQVQQEVVAGRDDLASLLGVEVADLDTTLAALDTAAQGETMQTRLMQPAIEPGQRPYPLPVHSSYGTPQGDLHFDALGQRVGPQGEPLV